MTVKFVDRTFSAMFAMRAAGDILCQFTVLPGVSPGPRHLPDLGKSHTVSLVLRSSHATFVMNGADAGSASPQMHHMQLAGSIVLASLFVVASPSANGVHVLATYTAPTLQLQPYFLLLLVHSGCLSLFELFVG